MPNVKCNDQVFYRIEHPSNVWEDGRKSFCCSSLNQFTTNWRQTQCPKPNGRSVRRRALKAELAGSYDKLITNRQSADAEDFKKTASLATSALKCLDDHLLAQRELTLELTRRVKFPESVSRMHCCFLASRESLVPYWLHHLDTQGGSIRKVFKVVGTGVYSECDADLLVPLELQSVASLEAIAERYWRGGNTLFKSSEVLFVGTLRIVAELNVRELLDRHVDPTLTPR